MIADPENEIVGLSSGVGNRPRLQYVSTTLGSIVMTLLLLGCDWERRTV